MEIEIEIYIEKEIEIEITDFAIGVGKEDLTRCL